MSEAEKPADKPHEPTPRKLEDARKKGEIPRSADLNTAVTYGGFLLAGAMLAPWLVQTLGDLMRASLGQADRMAAVILAPGGTTTAAAVIGPVILALGALITVPAGVLLVTLFGQRGLLFSPAKLEPKLSRISPISNAQQKYGAQGLFQFAKSAVKLSVVSLLLALYLWARAEPIMTSIYAAPGQVMLLLGRLVLDFLIAVTGMSAVIGGIDWLWEWQQHQTKNRMSRQELMDEAKTAEGDPHMKQERRQRGQAIAMNRMLGDVPKADVVIVNPTHYAVALQWDRARGGVPICLAKGVDSIAARIRERAAEAGVPIFSDSPDGPRPLCRDRDRGGDRTGPLPGGGGGDPLCGSDASEGAAEGASVKRPDPRLEQLCAVSRLLADCAQAPVTAARTARDIIKGRIEAMAAHRRQLMQSATDPVLAATMLAQAERLRQAQAREMMALARAEARLATAQKAAARAVGRKHALAELQRKDVARHKRHAARRRNYG
ncbi:Flagellar biosynthesis protein FlhB [Roseibacterium elongatum DSM 19469]|uniref:Flagellar biosynthesis protein FlhB n=1 Tax=Roseicyclus elongatus DSM 19469 TaxID=1294273 RepID=W8RRK0_9RHOB|nr:Flagellar biosynthesis protein FlhB [Roseibacterium elongatum DSM 19469]